MKFLWRKKHGKVTNTILGKHPSEYDLDRLYSSDHKHAKQFLTDLVEYQLETGKKVLFVNILDLCNPTQSRVTQAPVCSIISDFSRNLQQVRDSQMSLSEKTDRILNILLLSDAQRLLLEEETREQVGSFTWRKAREYRITASFCHRVISYTGKTSGEAVVMA